MDQATGPRQPASLRRAGIQSVSELLGSAKVVRQEGVMPATFDWSGMVVRKLSSLHLNSSFDILVKFLISFGSALKRLGPTT